MEKTDDTAFLDRQYRNYFSLVKEIDQERLKTEKASELFEIQTRAFKTFGIVWGYYLLLDTESGKIFHYPNDNENDPLKEDFNPLPYGNAVLTAELLKADKSNRGKKLNEEQKKDFFKQLKELESDFTRCIASKNYHIDGQGKQKSYEFLNLPSVAGVKSNAGDDVHQKLENYSFKVILSDEILFHIFLDSKFEKHQIWNYTVQNQNHNEILVNIVQLLNYMKYVIESHDSSGLMSKFKKQELVNIIDVIEKPILEGNQTVLFDKIIEFFNNEISGIIKMRDDLRIRFNIDLSLKLAEKANGEVFDFFIFPMVTLSKRENEAENKLLFYESKIKNLDGENIVIKQPLLLCAYIEPIYKLTSPSYNNKSNKLPFQLSEKSETLDGFKATEMLCEHLSKTVVDSIFYGKLINKARTKELVKSQKAAIISRNLSHNLGSHLLSAVSNNYCHPSDMRVMCKYIQERMDFVAQVITNPPHWTAPTWFVRNIMRKLYEQRLLLKYIVRSEGLEGIEYGANNFEEKDKKCNLQIKLIVRGQELEFQQGNFNDELVSIPGGVVGFHAVYTIVENFLRNGAKHSWSSKDVKNRNEYILTLEIPKEVEKVKEEQKSISSYARSLSVELSDNIYKEEFEVDGLVVKLNKIINQDLVSDKGDIKESWGLAEIQIAAAYLSKKPDQNFINGQNTNEQKIVEYFKKKVLIQNKLKFSLGLRFILVKPKEIIIITNKSISKTKFLLLKENSIKAINISEMNESHYGDYEIACFFLDNSVTTNQSSIDENISRFGRRVIYEKLDLGLGNDFNELKSNFNAIIDNKEGSVDIEDFKLQTFGFWAAYRIRKYKHRYDIHDQESKIHINSSAESRSSKSYEFNYATATDVLTPNNIEPLEYFMEAAQYEYAKGVSFTEILNKYKKYRSSMNLENDEKEPSSEELYFLEYEEFVKKIFYKYEEDIESLPRFYRSGESNYNKSTIGNFSNPIILQELNNLPIVSKYIKASSSQVESDIILIRHGGAETGKNYFEYLSGAQSFFTLLESDLSPYDRNKLYLQILESVSLNIGIVDERVSEYCFKNKLTKERLENMNMHVYSTLENRYKCADSIIYCEQITEDLDFIIIHQSIIEKVFADRGKSQLEKISKTFKAHIILTTGRGRQSESLKDFSFISFSELREATLKAYPEKLMLINSLMKNTSIHG